MTTDFKNRVSRKKRLNFYIRITREQIFFFNLESSIPAPYSKEYSRHIVLLNKQKKIDFLKFGNPPNPLRQCPALQGQKNFYSRIIFERENNN